MTHLFPAHVPLGIDRVTPLLYRKNDHVFPGEITRHTREFVPSENVASSKQRAVIWSVMFYLTFSCKNCK